MIGASPSQLATLDLLEEGSLIDHLRPRRIIQNTAMAEASTSPFTPTSPITYGVEGEFILFGKALKEGEDRVAAERANPGIIMYPHDQTFPAQFCRLYVTDHLRAFGVTINDFDFDSDAPIPPLLEWTRAAAAANTYLEEYHRWSLKWDITVKLDETEKNDQFPDLIMLNLELITPVFQDCPATYVEIERVFHLIQRYFRYHVNDSCGLHVHIGAGRDHMEGNLVRRLAYMMWAADCLLMPLHVASRADNAQSPRNRFHSNLAFGMTGKEANEIVSRGIKDSRDKSDLSGFRNGTGPVGIKEGILELRACKSAHAVAKLMKCPRFDGPAAYDFHYYKIGKSRPGGRPTIECRIGGGSLNPKWIASWARIVVSLCHFAGAMGREELRGLAISCHEVETGVRPGMDVLYQFLNSGGLDDIVEFLKNTTPEERGSRV